VAQPVRDERQGSQGPAQEERYRKYFSWVILIGTTVWGIFSASWLAYHSLQQDSRVRRILEDHFGAFIGVPIAALMAMCVVILLRFSAGPIGLKGSRLSSGEQPGK
jgi:hypothetical protein